MRTLIREVPAKMDRPVLIGGLPGLGSVGRIAASFLIRELGAKRVAALYSPYFPHYGIVNSKGVVRLPKNDFYYWRSGTNGAELLILTGDCQPQSPRGQYEVALKILEYAKSKSVKLIVTIGGYSAEEREVPRVYGATNSYAWMERLKGLGVEVDVSGVPIVGMAGLIPALARSKGLDALCLLGETVGYMPDPKAAKAVLSVVMGLLGLELNLSNLDPDIERMAELKAKLREAERRVEGAMRRASGEGPKYIS
ncbi:MAG: PAC2 family protein [Candidatus Bathyarchaeia archaeon]